SRNRDDGRAERTACPIIAQKEKAMIPGRIGWWKRAAGVTAVLLGLGGLVQGQDKPSDLKAILLQQQKELQELQEKIRQRNVQQAGAEADAPKSDLDEGAVKKIVGSYLQE